MEDKEVELPEPYASAPAQLEQLNKEIVCVLDLCPGAVRVREGGGPENIAASLAVTVAGLRNDIQRLSAALKECANSNLNYREITEAANAALKISAYLEAKQ